EERYGRGGAFTLSLLIAAQDFKTGLDLCPVMIEDLLPTVKKTLVSQHYMQPPDVVYKTGNLRIPFLIDTEQIIVEEKVIEPEYINIESENKPSLFKVI